MSRLDLTSESGMTLVEIVLSLALLAVLAMVAFTLIQSTDLMMRRGTAEAHASQAMRAAVEEIKATVHVHGMEHVCGPTSGELDIDGNYTARYTCTNDMHDLSDLYRIDVAVFKVGGDTPAVPMFSFLLTEGGY